MRFRRLSRSGAGYLLAAAAVSFLAANLSGLAVLRADTYRTTRLTTQETLAASEQLLSAEVVLSVEAMLGRGAFDTTSTGPWHTSNEDSLWTTNLPVTGGGWRNHVGPCDWDNHDACWRAHTATGTPTEFRGGAVSRDVREVSIQTAAGCVPGPEVRRGLTPETLVTGLRTLLGVCEDVATSVHRYGRRAFTGYSLHATVVEASPEVKSGCPQAWCADLLDKTAALTAAVGSTDPSVHIHIDERIVGCGSQTVSVEQGYGTGRWFDPPSPLTARAADCAAGAANSATVTLGGLLPVPTLGSFAREYEPFCDNDLVLCPSDNVDGVELGDVAVRCADESGTGSSPNLVPFTGSLTWACEGDVTVAWEMLMPEAGETETACSAGPTQSTAVLTLVSFTGDIVFNIDGCSTVDLNHVALLAPAGTVRVAPQPQTFRTAGEVTGRVQVSGAVVARYVPVFAMSSNAGTRFTGWPLHLRWPWSDSPPLPTWWPSLVIGEWQRIN